MTLLGHFAPWCGISFVLLLGSVNACSTDDSNSFSSGGIGNKGGSTSTMGGGGTTATGTTAPTTTPNAGSNSIVTEADAGVYVPDSTIVEDPDTFTTSCENEGCTGDEGCFESCPSGSCCVHSCEGQTGTTSSDITCCDRMGGIVPGASCR